MIERTLSSFHQTNQLGEDFAITCVGWHHCPQRVIHYSFSSGVK